MLSDEKLTKYCRYIVVAIFFAYAILMAFMPEYTAYDNDNYMYNPLTHDRINVRRITSVLHIPSMIMYMALMTLINEKYADSLKGALVGMYITYNAMFWVFYQFDCDLLIPSIIVTIFTLLTIAVLFMKRGDI